MTSPAVTREEALQELARRACAASFEAFLSYVWIQGDDPANPEPIRIEPWEFQVELAREWADGGSMVLLKPRQIGFSWLSAAYKLWRAMYSHWAVGYFSAGDREVRQHIDERVVFIWQRLPRWLRVPYQRKDLALRFEGGGSIIAFPSTPDAGIGFTFQMVETDEASAHPYGQANYGNYRPTISAGGQWICGSTANQELGPHGFFHDMYQAAKLGRLGAVVSRFLPWNIRPGRDGAWYAREQAAYAASPELADKFNAHYPATDAEAFVGKSGLVFHMFTPQRHVRPAHPMPWKDCKYRVVGIDFGGKGANVTALVALGVYQDRGAWRMHQYAEFYQRGIVDDQTVAEAWRRIDVAGRIDRTWVDAGSGTSSTVATLNTMGMRCLEPEERDVRARNQWHAWALDSNMLTISASCPNSIAEYGGYRWTEKTDPNSKTRYQTGTPVDHHADAIDARGYAIQGVLMTLLNYEPPTVRSLRYGNQRVRPQDMPMEEYIVWRRGQLEREQSERERERAAMRRAG